MYGFTQDLPITPEVWFRLKTAIGTEPVDGQVMHAVTRHNGGIRYIDIWESREQCDRFLEERVHPVLRTVFAASGQQLPAEPDREEFEVVDVSIGETSPASI